MQTHFDIVLVSNSNGVNSNGVCGLRPNITGEKLVPFTPQCFCGREKNDIQDSS